MAETAEERGARWIAELDEIERLTPTQLRQGLRTLAEEDSFAGLVARAVLAKVGDAICAGTLPGQGGER